MSGLRDPGRRRHLIGPCDKCGVQEGGRAGTQADTRNERPAAVIAAPESGVRHAARGAVSSRVAGIIQIA
jgi:hypothetical protein